MTRAESIANALKIRWQHHQKSYGNCVVCGARFRYFPYRKGKSLYCSRPCWYKTKKGKVFAPCKPGERRSPATEFVGDALSYGAVHMWIKRHRGTPMTCERCGVVKEKPQHIQWSNKSGKYKREFSDWERLCVRCHRAHEKTLRKLATIKQLELVRAQGYRKGWDDCLRSLQRNNART